MACSIYTLNRSLNSKNKNLTPYELWFGTKPTVSNLHIFGQEAVIFNQAYKSKFEPRDKSVRFVGYTQRTNTYRLFDIVNNKIICNSNVLVVILFFQQRHLRL